MSYQNTFVQTYSNQFLILQMNYWVQLQNACRNRSAAFRVNKAFHEISSEHEMKWKLNAVELVPSTSAAASGAFHSTEVTPGLSSLKLLSQFPAIWKMQSTQVCAGGAHRHTATGFVQSQRASSCIPLWWSVLGPSGSSRDIQSHTRTLLS